jgi:hypothetical protein
MHLGASTMVTIHMLMPQSIVLDDRMRPSAVAVGQLKQQD